MKFLRREFLSLALSLSLALAALAFAPLRGAEFKYLSAHRPDPVALLAPPVPADAPEYAAELEMTFRAYASRTPAELARARDETDRLTIFHFAPAIGAWFVPGKFPRTEALFATVEAEAKAVTSVAKKHWRRLRPYHVAPARFPDSIEHEAETDYGYPSGHSTRGTLFALLLAEALPERRAELLAKGRDSGWLRVLGGVHFPSDVQAGRVLGQALAQAFLASPAFQQDFAAVRAELTAASGQGT